MLARLAENLYLAGRGLERAEATARMVDVTYHTLLESPAGEVTGSWDPLLDVLDAWEGLPQREVEPPVVLRHLLVDRSVPVSVVSVVTRAREHVRSARELVSTELWEVINDLYLSLIAGDGFREVDEHPYDLFVRVRRACLTLYGVASETMPRDDAWRFLALGRALERAGMTLRLVGVRYQQLESLAGPSRRLGPASAAGGVPTGRYAERVAETTRPSSPSPGRTDLHQWVAVLKSAAALDAYRRRYRASMDPADVVEFLLLEPDLPRSVVFCLTSARNQLEALARGRRSRAVRELGRATASLTYRDVSELFEIGLHGFLADIHARMARVDHAITSEFFRHHPSGALHAIAST